MQMQNKNGKKYGKSTKTDTIMKSENNKNWQHRKNIIGDTGCQETEMRKEKWYARKYWIMTFGMCIIFFLFILSIILLNINNGKVTFVNMTLGLIAINGGFCLIKYIIIKMDWHRYTKIPLGHNTILKNITLPDYWKDSTGKKFKFSKIDDQKIIIDNDHIFMRVFSFIIFLCIFLFFVYYADFTLSNLVTKDYLDALSCLEAEVIAIVGGISSILMPWKRIIIDRTSKTITLPGRFIFQKRETLPYDKFAITLDINEYAKSLSGNGEEEVAITNLNRPSCKIATGIAGGINAARQFARFIQLYMEEEEVQNIPEFEKYSHIIES